MAACALLSTSSGSPSDASTRCPSASTAHATPFGGPVDVAGVQRSFWKWQAAEHRPGDLERCAKVCACWGIDLRRLDLAFAHALLQALMGTLRLFHDIELGEGDLECILAAACEYGVRLDFGVRLTTADQREALLEAVMVFFLAQTYVCDEPCVVSTWLDYVVKPAGGKFLRIVTPCVGLEDLDYAVLALFGDLQHLLAVPQARCELLCGFFGPQQAAEESALSPLLEAEEPAGAPAAEEAKPAEATPAEEPAEAEATPAEAPAAPQPAAVPASCADLVRKARPARVKLAPAARDEAPEESGLCGLFDDWDAAPESFPEESGLCGLFDDFDAAPPPAVALPEESGLCGLFDDFDAASASTGAPTAAETADSSSESGSDGGSEAAAKRGFASPRSQASEPGRPWFTPRSRNASISVDLDASALVPLFA